MNKTKNTSTNLTEGDLAAERMGRNSLHGNDQDNMQNQRKAMPERLREPDANVRDTFRKMDKDVRARAELGKRSEKKGSTK